MTRILQRSCLIFLAVAGAFVGLWAYLAPLNWYNTFPGFGLQWLPVLGPFNEHFAKDVGAFYLGLCVLSIVGLVYLNNRPVIVAVAAAWSVFNILHLIYHLTMLHMYCTRDAIGNAVSLSLFVVVSLALLIPVQSGNESSGGR